MFQDVELMLQDVELVLQDVELMFQDVEDKTERGRKTFFLGRKNLNVGARVNEKARKTSFCLLFLSPCATFAKKMRGRW